MPATLTDSTEMARIIAELRAILTDTEFVPWISARWVNTLITGRPYLDNAHRAYLHAEGTWWIEGRDTRTPDAVAAAVPTWQHAPTPMRTTDLAAVVNTIERTTTVKKPVLADATFVNRETCMTITGGRTRLNGDAIEILACHRWIPLRKARTGMPGTLARLEIANRPEDHR